MQTNEFDADKLAALVDPDGRAAFILEAAAESDIVHVLGDIDIANVGDFESTIALAAKSERRVIVNLLRCHYIDSTALKALWNAHDRLGARFGLVAFRGGPIQRIFDISGMGDFLGVAYEDTSTATA